MTSPVGTTTHAPSARQARAWVRRWERQQERYAIGREERFGVVLDVVEHVSMPGAAPLVLDLGSGPGCLAVRLRRRLPAARVVAVDADPLVVHLARACRGRAARYVEAEIGAPGWVERLGLDGPLDAACAVTALHYLPVRTLELVYGELAAALRPGGVLVNADHLPADDGAVAGIAAELGRRRLRRSGADAHEDWASWWASAARDPHLGALVEQGRSTGLRHVPDNGLTLAEHNDLLHGAGFGSTGSVWQHGHSHVLVAVR